MRNLPIIDIITTLPAYVISRLKAVIVIAQVSWDWLNDTFTATKTYLVSRMFWGRGSLYKNAFHIIIAGISIVALLGGLASKIQPAQAQAAFSAGAENGFSNDFLHQGASLETAVVVQPGESDFQAQIREHVVQKGDTVAGLAQRYDVTEDTIRWANIALIGPFSNHLEAGWKLAIPQMNGILHEVKEGETLEQIVARTQGNLFEVRQLNDLTPPDYAIRPGQQIFIPSGNPYVYEGEVNRGMLIDAFQDPLSHPACIGYTFYGGFTETHNGLDLVKGLGCPIRAVAAGVVEHAGWWGGGGGYTVIINHGGGIETHYYHGNGEIWVKKGDRVTAGQDIMYMGTTGNSSGTHLHFSIFQNKVAFDPTGYVPYKVVYPF